MTFRAITVTDPVPVHTEVKDIPVGSLFIRKEDAVETIYYKMPSHSNYYVLDVTPGNEEYESIIPTLVVGTGRFVGMYPDDEVRVVIGHFNMTIDTTKGE